MKQSEQAVRSTRQERMETMRRTFLESAVRVVAQYGLERTTTKLISNEANLNEAYIYRCFENKEMLLREAFLEEDKHFVQLLQKTLPVMRREHCSWKERAFLLWQPSWAFILEKEADCSFYYRYYYSASCQKYAYEDHLNCYRPLLEEIRGSFLPGTNLSLLLHQLFATMLTFAGRVVCGAVANSPELTRWAFAQIYCFIAPNIRPELLSEEGKEAV